MLIVLDPWLLGYHMRLYEETEMNVFCYKTVISVEGFIYSYLIDLVWYYHRLWYYRTSMVLGSIYHVMLSDGSYGLELSTFGKEWESCMFDISTMIISVIG
ncbi:hypothetical protein OUZ56_006911 [Daphnia magna]|uniref:Uncharacterized protein n=1 Tax=Daphnia magna TaxID=35525 RepID=A0ABQ9YX11_9CRUS|nr:hypothetical protein OUZ56_006911 [Daphnia magna]